MSVRIEIEDSTGRLNLDKFKDTDVWEVADLYEILNEDFNHPLSGTPVRYTSIEGFHPFTVAAFLGDPPQDSDGDAFGKEEIANQGQFLGDVVVLLATPNKEAALRLLDKIRERIATDSYTYEETEPEFEFIEDYWLAANTTSVDKDSEPDRSEAEIERQTAA